MVLLSSNMSLLIFCLLYWSISDKEVLKSPTIMVDSSISPCSSISFCLAYFYVLFSYSRDCYVFLEYWPLHHFVNPLSMPDNLHCSEICSIWNLYTLTFFWLVLPWHFFLHPCSIILYMSMYSKWVSCRQHIAVSCFLIHSHNLNFLIGVLDV